MSWAMTTAVAPLVGATNSAKAAPIARATSSSHCVGHDAAHVVGLDDR